MKLSALWDQAKDNTSKASDIVRQVAFGGIALIWIFKTGTDSAPDLDRKLVLSACLLMSALAFDLLQHVLTGWKFRRFAKASKAKLVKDKVPNDQHGDYDFPLPSNFHAMSGFFYWGKVVLVIAAYVLIGIYLSRKFFI